MKVYLDACCLNRPFDDQTQIRIRLESEAVLTLLYRCEIGEWRLISSEVVNFEISKMPDTEKKEKVCIFKSLVHSNVIIDNKIEKGQLNLKP